ncbi:polysaccharide biosynthesis protein [Intrasporangium calvum]|uniref:Polysaccharide biosynthesis protein CapD n=1 Tax=Intrasporangium calvum (strain ATCC 23552 / DSM 43043 / JCM 3097 / NBRC 12989 / NCIMB 10167 / NRRL B-3866 / 7 KIP) TaxID=710696 RepID=E6S8I9_INTC7|nr:nucleoside-diphosphate sugar epimerase/dehydratase [Intrasporangium calvum]ADU49151.1 polysaccharide biosynthesis protein CapD [Intrasporangium calvum DSM 43043]
MSISIFNDKRSLVIMWDALSWLVALLAFALVRFGMTLPGRVWQAALTYIVLAIVLQVVAGYHFHLYRGRSRLGSFDEVSLSALIVAGISVLVGGWYFITQPVFSRSLVITVPALAFVIMGAGRWAFRTASGNARRQRGQASAVPALVYGAGEAGHQVAQLVDFDDDAPYAIVGFLDDDPSKRFLRVRGRRVLGRGADLLDVAGATGAEVVIVAITHASPQLLQDLSDRCIDAGLNLVVVPPVREMIGGRVELDKLREFNVTDLLGRREIETSAAQISSYVSDKVVLITGAGGSIGSELARQVHALGPASLVLLDRDESALHAVQLSIDGSGLLDADNLVLCDIRDIDALAHVFDRHRPDVVFHAAALKHLPMLERFPEEGWKTNVLGTLNVLQCAVDVEVAHFVNVSTDKAADATSVLGQTKRLAERLTAWFGDETGRSYLSVRFGNVLGSRGSVLDTFRAQIDRGGPVTVTDPDVTRYFMTIPEACELVLQAGAIGAAGDVLVLDMGQPVRIVDVARRLIDESGRSVDITFTGLRQGEKLHEVLLSSAEQGRPTSHALITRVSAPPLDPVPLLADKVTESDLGDLVDERASTCTPPRPTSMP